MGGLGDAEREAEDGNITIHVDEAEEMSKVIQIGGFHSRAWWIHVPRYLILPFMSLQVFILFLPPENFKSVLLLDPERLRHQGSNSWFYIGLAPCLCHRQFSRSRLPCDPRELQSRSVFLELTQQPPRLSPPLSSALPAPRPWV